MPYAMRNSTAKTKAASAIRARRASIQVNRAIVNMPCIGLSGALLIPDDLQEPFLQRAPPRVQFVDPQATGNEPLSQLRQRLLTADMHPHPIMYPPHVTAERRELREDRGIERRHFELHHDIAARLC